MDSLLSNSKSTVVTVQERKSFDFPPKTLYENRYCHQDDFSVLVCGGYNDKSRKKVNSVYKMYGDELKCEKFTSMPEELSDCKTAVLNSDLFVFGRYKQYGEYDTCVRKFCSKTKTWTCKLLSEIEYNDYIVCSFKQNIYVIRHTSSCFVYNFETNKLSPLADMIERRYDSACSVYEGKIVVTGGLSKSVEAYDFYENKWNYYPKMNEKRDDHASVSMGNKLFVIGGYHTSSCEVFDNFSRKFTYIKADIPKYKNTLLSKYRAVSKGSFILIIRENKYKDSYASTLYIYDVKKSQWLEKNCRVLKNLTDMSCVKYCVD